MNSGTERKILNKMALILCGALLMVAPVSADWRSDLADAQPGAVIEIPAGIHAIDNLSIPSGVTLIGAAGFKTELDAGGNADGIVLDGVTNVTLRHLIVRDASKANLIIRNAQEVTLSGVRSENALIGMSIMESSAIRVETCLVVDNRIGISLNNVKDSALVNNTLNGNTSLGFSLVDTSNVAVFNNIVANGATGIYVSGAYDGVAVDHNAYFVNFVGKKPGDVYTGYLMEQWRDTSGGFDVRSFFGDADLSRQSDQFGKPLQPKTWAPGEAISAGLGVAELNGFKAPQADVHGNPWHRHIDIGAWNSALEPAGHPANGSFTVEADEGLKSAGIYDEQGRLIVYLFQNLPLPAGTYSYWIPMRDIFGQPIPAGDYAFNMVESNIKPKYVTLLASNAGSSAYHAQKGFHDHFAVFDNENRPYLVKGWSENHVPIRAYDKDLQELRWNNDGNDHPTGAVVVDDSIYWMTEILAAHGTKTDAQPVLLRRLSIEDGQLLDVVEAIDPAETGAQGNKTEAKRQIAYPDLLTKGPGRQRGLAAGAGKLFVPDPQLGRIYHTPVANPSFQTYWRFDSPWSVSFDEGADVLWFISGGEYQQRDPELKKLTPIQEVTVGGDYLWAPRADARVLGISPETGEIVAQHADIKQPMHLSAQNGRLAVLTGEGKVHVFDTANPQELKPVRTLGKGTAPHGPISDEVFTFNYEADSAVFTPNATVAIDGEGRLLVIDWIRTMLFDADGDMITMDYGQWGQHSVLARFAGEDDIRIFGPAGTDSIKVDSKNKTWEPDRFWSRPNLPFNRRHPMGFFNKEGRTFGVSELVDMELRAKQLPSIGYAVLEYLPDGIIKPWVVYWAGLPDKSEPGVIRITDTDGDGQIRLDGSDRMELLRDKDGNPPLGLFSGRYGCEVRENGDLVVPGNFGPRGMGLVYAFEGFDDEGRPLHNFANATFITASVRGDARCVVPSPYDWETQEALHTRNVQTAPTSDGGLMTSASLNSSGGTGLQNGHGTDILGYGPDGELRWIHLFAHMPGIGGVQSLPSLGLGLGMYGECVYNLFDDKTGLGLGSLGMTPESGWRGMWSDHAQQQYPWIGNDGKPYYYISDYALNAHHMYEITGTETIRRVTEPVTITEAQAEQMAATTAEAPGLPAVVPPPRTMISRLQEPLPIDGDPEKWRQAGVPVSIVVTPETAKGDITGPEDCSALLRLAYEGDNLYIQAIVFDDVVTFHQPVEKMYQMDGIEICINSFMRGLKFNLAIVDGVPTVKRDKFWHKDTTVVYDNRTVPRSIIVYDDASLFPEREMIEGIYGVDLSQSKVIAYEMKLPLNDKAAFVEPLQGSKIIERVASGEEFYLGLFINDNDDPGADVQDILAFPATYGTFQAMEQSATAVFE